MYKKTLPVFFVNVVGHSTIKEGKKNGMSRAEYTYGTPAYSRRAAFNAYRSNQFHSQVRDDARRDERERRNASRRRTTQTHVEMASATGMEGIHSSDPATRTVSKVAWLVFGIVVVVLIILL